jgi:hypothetical protein
MAFKNRTESKELKVLRRLNLRMDLPVKDAKKLYKLEKGFKGERMFDELLDSHSENWLTLNDLFLESNHTYFQNDSTFIFRESIHVVNVKNYEGDYYINSNGEWYSGSEKITVDPLEQLNRSENLFKQLLDDLGYKFSVEPYLIFINPGFYLYNAPRNLPAVFPTQLKRYKNKLLSIPSAINERTIKLAQKLVSLHQLESPYTQYPKYHYENLKKGITCVTCDSFITGFYKHFLVCDKCGCIEDVEAAILRCVDELLLLFPERKITTNIVKDWCQIIPERTIRRILLKHFKNMGHSSSSFYIKP